MWFVYTSRGFAPLSSHICDLGDVVPVPQTWVVILADLRHHGYHAAAGCVRDTPGAALHWSRAHVGFGRCLLRH